MPVGYHVEGREQGIVDPDEVGIMGWSQGGFITAFSSIYSNRFKVASVGGGISNWVTNYKTTDLPSNVLSYSGPGIPDAHGPG